MTLIIFCSISDRGGLKHFAMGGGGNKYLCVLLFCPLPGTFPPPPVRKQNYNRGGQAFAL